MRVSALLVVCCAAIAFAEPEVSIECPAGTHFVKDKGCRANVVEAPQCPGGTRYDGKKCGGVDLEVHGAPRLTGVRTMLLANGARIGEETDVNVGKTAHITGTAAGKAIDLRITQAVFGTWYLLKVGGVECKLGK